MDLFWLKQYTLSILTSQKREVCEPNTSQTQAGGHAKRVNNHNCTWPSKELIMNYYHSGCQHKRINNTLSYNTQSYNIQKKQNWSMPTALWKHKKTPCSWQILDNNDNTQFTKFCAIPRSGQFQCWRAVICDFQRKHLSTLLWTVTVDDFSRVFTSKYSLCVTQQDDWIAQP